jgi:hypothetical protein
MMLTTCLTDGTHGEYGGHGASPGSRRVARKGSLMNGRVIVDVLVYASLLGLGVAFWWGLGTAFVRVAF